MIVRIRENCATAQAAATVSTQIKKIGASLAKAAATLMGLEFFAGRVALRRRRRFISPEHAVTLPP
jgi:hypothetical protein